MTTTTAAFSSGKARLEKSLAFVDKAAEDLVLADFSTPLATISGSALRNNIRSMAEWCHERNLFLAPHGKTTMAPDIWQLQLDAGAWAITVATPAQLRVARSAGVPRVVIANEFVDPAALRWTYAQLAIDPEWNVICWVDSLDGVAQMAAQYDGRSRAIDVCVEFGSVRGGARNLSLMREIARAVNETPALRLVGVAGYEGVITESAEAAEIALVDDYLEHLVEAYHGLQPYFETAESVISAGGSAYYDRVSSILGPLASRLEGSNSTRVLLRPGVYVVHDNGLYEQIAPHQRGEGPHLVGAMKVWARVLSRPQSDLALLDAGCRDLSFDVGMPVPERASRAGTWLPDEYLRDASITSLNDQHAYLRLEPTSPIVVGDIVRLGLSHPCTTFDKWAAIPLIDDDPGANPGVTGFVHTYF